MLLKPPLRIGQSNLGLILGRKKRKQNLPAPVEDVALSERLQDLIENKLQQYVPRLQDRTAVETFYRARDFAPLWANAKERSPLHNR